MAWVHHRWKVGSVLKPSKLIGQKVEIVDIRMTGTSLGEDELTAGITMRLENGDVVNLCAFEWQVALKLEER